jgi:hypothetical protein
MLQLKVRPPLFTNWVAQRTSLYQLRVFNESSFPLAFVVRRLPCALDEQKGPIGSSDVPPTRRAVPDLAKKYSRTAEFDLGIDLHEDSPLSNFVSKLLDIAYKRQVQLGFANQNISSLKNKIETLETKEKGPEDDLPRLLYPFILFAVVTKLMNRIG